MIASTDFSGSVRITGARSITSPSARAALARDVAQHDSALVLRFNGGDESAFVEIITRYRERMFSVAFSLLRNRADAEEIAQDTFIRAHRGLARFRGDSSLATWLHRIALNLARNRYWYNHRRRQHLARSFDSAFSDDNQATLASLVASSGPTPVQDASTTEFSALIASCMERLGASHREILTRRNILNCSYAEIAQTFGISVGTVKSRIARARENLRVLLAKSCPEFAPDAAPGEWFDPVRPSGCVEAICA
jgi:RNA polymerase sigma-70 factor (ECF subfamily)